jgi:hypothetical protein
MIDKGLFTSGAETAAQKKAAEADLKAQNTSIEEKNRANWGLEMQCGV